MGDTTLVFADAVLPREGPIGGWSSGSGGSQACQALTWYCAAPLPRSRRERCAGGWVRWKRHLDGTHERYADQIVIEGQLCWPGDGQRLADELGQEVTRGQQFLHRPGISVVRDAEITAGGHHMRGTQQKAVWQPLWPSGVGLWARHCRFDKVTLISRDVAFCRALGLDPLGQFLHPGRLLVRRRRRMRIGWSRRLMPPAGSIIGQVIDGPPLVDNTTANGTVPFPALPATRWHGYSSEHHTRQKAI